MIQVAGCATTDVANAGPVEYEYEVSLRTASQFSERGPTRIRWIHFYNSTSGVKDAGTDEDFNLFIVYPGNTWHARFPELDHDERKKNQTDDYWFDVGAQQFYSDVIRPEHFFMEILGGDAWLPSGFSIVALDESGRICWNFGRAWPQQFWFSMEADDHNNPPARAKWNIGSP
ncbi:MAG: hypothetical protein ACKVS8_06035 [Phycisphaerales bacterium]